MRLLFVSVIRTIPTNSRDDVQSLDVTEVQDLSLLTLHKGQCGNKTPSTESHVYVSQQTEVRCHIGSQCHLRTVRQEDPNQIPVLPSQNYLLILKETTRSHPLVKYIIVYVSLLRTLVPDKSLHIVQIKKYPHISFSISLLPTIPTWVPYFGLGLSTTNENIDFPKSKLDRLLHF